MAVFVLVFHLFFHFFNLVKTFAKLIFLFMRSYFSFFFSVILYYIRITLDSAQWEEICKFWELLVGIVASKLFM